jgi:SAM-dependent methyltransferase
MGRESSDPRAYDGAAVKELARRIARCPECGGELAWDGPVTCTGCGAAYRTEDGVAVLLAGEAAPELQDAWYPGVIGMLPERLRGVAARYGPRLRPTLTFKSRHAATEVNRFVGSLRADAVVVNVGSGETSYGPNVVNLDIGPFRNVDLVGVAERLPIAGGSCDGVILMAVLEHVRDAEQTLSEARRVLAPGGSLFVDVPFIQGFHASPHDYRRYTEPGLREAVERIGFEVEASGVAVGPGSAAAWIGSEFLALLLSGRSARAYRLLRPLTGWLVTPVKFADAWLDRHPMAYTVASAVWVRARLPGELRG